MDKKTELHNLNKEIKRLELKDKALIAKQDLFRRKLERHLKLKTKTKKELQKIEADFDDKFSDLRVKVGEKRIKYLKMRLDLIGNPKTVRVDESGIDKIIGSL